MTELQVEEFARRAVSAVELPDLAEIAARGRRRRRRRWTVAAATTTVVALGGYLAVVDGDPDVRPVEDPESEVRH
jgi:3',5'-cyclic AMP phosphodiesterase CpdA